MPKNPRKPDCFDEGVSAAFAGAITRQNASDVKRANPYRKDAPHG